ncbi:hypothetical protein [Streptomyces rimosus]|uniref:hypothetical protein n=1 Tax=Streptomyces rimosus TaxID=1927 RepID=UPI0004CB8D86|nr:hypothetical protein [Streptomyces rimosus]
MHRILRSAGVTATLALAMAGTSAAAASTASATDGKKGSVRVCNKGAYLADFVVTGAPIGEEKFVGSFPVGQCKTVDKLPESTLGYVTVEPVMYALKYTTGFWQSANDGGYGHNWVTISREQADPAENSCYEVHGSNIKAWTTKVAC